MKGVVMLKRNVTLVLLFITGAIILIYPHVAQQVNKTVQRSHAEEVIETYRTLDPELVEARVNEMKRCNEAIFQGGSNVHDPFTYEYDLDDIEQCRNMINAEGAIASIEIPSLHLFIPIYVGAKEKQLSQGIGQVEGSSLPLGGANTHTVLAGHRGMGTKAMFRNLDELQRGDIFYIHTVDTSLMYEVFDVEVILPTETENLHIEQGKDLASLITCHPYRHNSHRLVVHGERKKNEKGDYENE